MKKTILTLVVAIIFVNLTFAQINIEPLGYNPMLVQWTEGVQEDKVMYLPVGASIEICASDFSNDEIRSFSIQTDNKSMEDVQPSGTCYTFIGTEVGKSIVNFLIETADSKMTIRRIVEVRASLELPIMDDFSYVNTSKGRPDNSLWLDKQVYINDHLGYEAPSIGVASFDGLDEQGVPYTHELATNDSLTSTFIDLSTYDSSDNVYLSYTYQPKGNALSPDRNDSLFLQFRDVDGNWNTVFTMNEEYRSVRDTLGSLPFIYKEIKLEDAMYLYEDFQFRFVNYVEGPKGFNSMYHVDYIKLVANFHSNPSKLINKDVAFSYSPKSLLREYSAMPLKQFLNNPRRHLTDTFIVDVFNHNTNGVSIIESTFGIIETIEGIEIAVPGQQLIDGPEVSDLRNVELGTYQRAESIISPSVITNILDELADNLEGKDRAILRTEFELNEESEDIVRFPSLESNGKAFGNTYLFDYYAYDDGLAERQASIADRARFAVEFEIYEKDTIKGIMINFPLIYEDFSGESFSYQIIEGSLENTPLYSNTFSQVSYREDVENANKFTYFEFEGDNAEGIELNAGKFYVVIISGSGSVVVGYDVQYDRRDKNFGFYQGEWSSLSNFTPGNLMIRAVMVNYEEEVANVEISNEQIEVFPNPAQAYITVSSEFIGDVYRIINELGQTIQSGDITGLNIDIVSLVSGQYQVLILDKNKTGFVGRFIKA